MTDTDQLPPSEREAFEAFAQNCPMGKYSIARRGDGYDSSHTQLMWDAWQARAIPAQRPVQVPMTDEEIGYWYSRTPSNFVFSHFKAAIRSAEAHHDIAAQAKKETP
jgi:hypothetical protein